MITKLHESLRRHQRDQEGALSAEYVAVIIVIGLVVAALMLANIDGKVKDCGEQAVDAVFDVKSDENPC
jgi:Flp pilus assembly pilin Flp